MFDTRASAAKANATTYLLLLAYIAIQTRSVLICDVHVRVIGSIAAA